MNSRSSGNEERHPDQGWQDWNDRGSRLVFGGFWVITFFATLLVAGPWAGFYGLLLGSVGILMWLCPPVVSLPRHWWLLAAVFVVAGAASFLPAGWFPVPEWRRQLELLGVETGPMVTIQARQAAEALLLYGIMLATGLWLAGHRCSSSQLRCWALVFTLGVAAYAVFSRIMQNPLLAGQTGGDMHFGFFPNRNHTGTYLAMGTICGLGCVLQALRDKRFVVLAVALAATAVCMWAVAGWSVSRGGVVLVVVGCLAWLLMLGRRYLGKHGLWALALMALAAIGLFFISDSAVKKRISDTAEKVGTAIETSSTPADLISGKSSFDSTEHLDFRIPVFLDTLDMIGDHPWTGIGAGQFYYVFPQYRSRTIVAQDVDAFHPESDWLWTAAELGVPAALALLALVMLAAVAAIRRLLAGRDRALRSACLVAALLVPLHGCFDVPGHRISLAWAAALLFSLSLHSTGARASKLRWPSRLTGAVLMLAAAFLIHAQWFGGRQPATIAAQAAIQQAQTLYQEDIELEKAAEAKGLPYQPLPEEDKLEQALHILATAKSAAPLDRNLSRHEAFLAIHFDEKFDRVDQAFAIDRALDPKWVQGPLRQGETWIHADPSRSVPLFNEALRRSKQVVQLDPRNRWNPVSVREYVRQLAGRYPELKRALDSVDQSEWQEFEK